MTTFKQYCQQLTRKIGCWKTARDSIAVGLGVHRLEVTRMLAGMMQANMARMDGMVERPVYPGYITVAIMAKHMRCNRQNVHQRIRHGSLEKPERDDMGRDVWRGDAYKHIWESVYHG